MTEKPAGKPLSSGTIEMTKLMNKNKADTGKCRGSGATYGAAFFSGAILAQ